MNEVVSYATFDDYSKRGGVLLDERTAPPALADASRLIDILTYNRIVAQGFDNLTDYQRGVIVYVTCALADWNVENADLIESPLSSYAINGVSVSYTDAPAIAQINGVQIPKKLFAHLETTGLTCGVIV